MSVKENIEQVRSKLTEEQVTEVGPVLKSIENEFSETQSGLTAANAESKQRKLKIRELEGKQEDSDVNTQALNNKITELQEKVDDPTTSKRMEELEMKVKDYQKKANDAFVQSFDQIHEHDRFEDAKHKFVIPEKDEDGNIKWDTISEEQRNANATALEELNSLKYFGEVVAEPAPHVIKGQRAGKYNAIEVAKMMNDPDPEVQKQARVLHERHKKDDLGATEKKSPFSNI